MATRPGDIFMTVSNKDSHNVFTSNTASHFKVCLDEYVDYTDYYRSCALLDLSLTTHGVASQPRDIYVCSNLVVEQRVGQRKEALLRRTLVRRDQYQMEKFTRPYYIPLKPIRGNTLEIYIRGEDGEEVSFLRGTTTCTLHLRRY